MIYLIQILSILFAIGLAKHDAPAVIHFEHYGIDNKQMAKFHRYNNWIKFFFCLLASTIFIPTLVLIFISGLLSFLWIYLIFDIALNKSRSGISWDYIGSNDADGKRWINWFGKKAGEIKAVSLLALIIVVNILKLIV